MYVFKDIYTIVFKKTVNLSESLLDLNGNKKKVFITNFLVEVLPLNNLPEFLQFQFQTYHSSD